MGFNRHGSIVRAAVLMVGLACAADANAELGGGVESVTADRVAFAAQQLRSTARLQYDVHEIDQGALIVREYVSRQGQVFAVTWHGPTPPDLHQLLGQYFPRFQSAAAAARDASPSMHRQFGLRQSDLVIQTVGRLRSFHGLAYLPALLPAGVSTAELQ